MIKRKAIVMNKFSNLKQADKIRDQIIRNKKELDRAYSRKEVTYYLDECMFTVKTFLKLDWSPKRMNVTVKTSEFNT